MPQFDDPNGEGNVFRLPIAQIAHELSRVERLVSPAEATKEAEELTNKITNASIRDAEAGLSAIAVFVHQQALVRTWLDYIRSRLRLLEMN